MGPGGRRGQFTVGTETEPTTTVTPSFSVPENLLVGGLVNARVHRPQPALGRGATLARTCPFMNATAPRVLHSHRLIHTTLQLSNRTLLFSNRTS
eukprot:2942171-Prymnesium_polylepis.4